MNWGMKTGFLTVSVCAGATRGKRDTHIKKTMLNLAAFLMERNCVGESGGGII